MIVAGIEHHGTHDLAEIIHAADALGFGSGGGVCRKEHEGQKGNRDGDDEKFCKRECPFVAFSAPIFEI